MAPPPYSVIDSFARSAAHQRRQGLFGIFSRGGQSSPVTRDAVDQTSPAYYPNVDATRDRAAYFLKQDSDLFARDGVQRLFLTTAGRLPEQIAKAQNYRHLAQIETQPTLRFNAANWLPNVEDYASSYKNISGWHEMLRTMSRPAASDVCPLIIGVKSGSSGHASGKFFDVPVSDVRTYAAECDLPKAQLSSRAIMHPNLFAQELPSARVSDTAVVEAFRDADQLVAAGLF